MRSRTPMTMNKRPPLRGQALVEFGLVIGLFMLVIGGLVQFGTFSGARMPSPRSPATLRDTPSPSRIRHATRSLVPKSPLQPIRSHAGHRWSRIKTGRGARLRRSIAGAGRGGRGLGGADGFCGGLPSLRQPACGRCASAHQPCRTDLPPRTATPDAWLRRRRILPKQRNGTPNGAEDTMSPIAPRRRSPED